MEKQGFIIESLCQIDKQIDILYNEINNKRTVEMLNNIFEKDLLEGNE